MRRTKKTVEKTTIDEIKDVIPEKIGDTIADSLEHAHEVLHEVVPVAKKTKVVKVKAAKKPHTVLKVFTGLGIAAAAICTVAVILQRYWQKDSDWSSTDISSAYADGDVDFEDKVETFANTSGKDAKPSDSYEKEKEKLLK